MPCPNSPRGRAVAVVGAGHWGRNLIRNFDELGVLAAICDTAAPARSEYAKRFPGKRIHDGIESVLRDPGVDAVVIATPAVTHGELVERSLAAGKHTFVEKPLCLDLAHAGKLGHLADENGLTLMVGHLMLYHPAFRVIRKLLADGELGGLRYIYSNRLNIGRVRREENALWSFAPHDISMILSLTGCLPQKIVGGGGHYLSPEVADTTITHMTFPGGIQAHIFVSWLHPFKDQRLVVVGDKAMVAFDDVLPAPEKLLLYRHVLDLDGAAPRVDKARAEPVPFDAAEPLRLECRAFLECIESGTRPPSDAHEGTRVLQVLDASQRAIDTGLPVALEAGDPA